MSGMRRCGGFCLAVLAAFFLVSCGQDNPKNLIPQEREEERVVNLFSPMEKTDPDAENAARTASDLTVAMAEEKLDITMVYRTYTAEDYQDRTYDEVALDRARSNLDDLYLLNPDTILILGREGLLRDLSGLDSAKNLREIIRTANTVDGKLVAIPQEVVAYGLFVNVDLFRQCGLDLPGVSGERHRHPHRRKPLVAGEFCLRPGLCGPVQRRKHGGGDRGPQQRGGPVQRLYAPRLYLPPDADRRGIY